MTIQNNQTSQDHKETTSEGQQSDHRHSPIKPMRGRHEEPSSELSKQNPVVSDVYTPSIRKCPYCKEIIQIEAIKCRFCGEFLNKPTNSYSSESSSYQSQSNIYQNSIPDGVAGWNWGAFSITLFWAFSMNQGRWGVGYLILWLLGDICISIQSRNPNSLIVTFNSMLSIISLCITIYLGVKGNELAWKSRKWDSVGQFRATQAVWNKWGCGILITIIVLIIIVPMIIIITTNCRPY